MKPGTVLLLGDANIDAIMPVAEFPVPGRDGLASDLSIEIGGAVVNTAIMLHKLGQPSRLLSGIGSDIWAEYLTRHLQGTRIDTRYLASKPNGATGLTFIIATPDGERTMFSYRGANALLDKHDVDERAFHDAALLHISGYALMRSPQKEAAWHAVSLAKEHGLEISIDTGLEPVIQNPRDLLTLLPSVSLFISGRQEVSQLLNCESPDKAADRLLGMGIRQVAVMMGRDGSLLADHSARLAFPAFPVRQVDSTGAGDSYAAGLLFGYLRGWGLRASAALASALGALAVTVYGAGFSLPYREKITRFLSSMRTEPAAAAFHPSIDEILPHLRDELDP